MGYDEEIYVPDPRAKVAYKRKGLPPGSNNNEEMVPGHNVVIRNSSHSP